MLDVTSDVRQLRAADLSDVWRLLDRDPVTNVFVDARVREAGTDLRRLGGQLWGYHDHGQLVSMCYAGANLIPVLATPAAARAFAERARRLGRNCSSVWGDQGAVGVMWRHLSGEWGPARALRAAQPFLTLDRAPSVACDPFVRPARRDELDVVYRSSVAFFREELGISPEARDGGASYRARVSSSIARGHTFVRLDGGEVIFKADIGVATSRAFQIQGVWVHPAYRGRGLAAPAVATVVAAGLAEVAPIATLYVNDFNVAARRTYARVGFRPSTTFMTVMF